MLTAPALPGQAAPGGVFGNARPRASIADNGDIAFAADLATPGGKGAEGVFLLSQGGIAPWLCREIPSRAAVRSSARLARW